MNLVLFGAGAVGLGIGSCLAAADDVSLAFVAERLRSAISERHGLRRSGIFASGTSGRPVTVVERIEELDARPVDSFWFCTKSFDFARGGRCLRTVPACESDSCRIVLFQNAGQF